MAEEKRYYWLKLKRDFFKRHDIQIIESQENGKDYVLFYLKLLVESVDHNGKLRFSETIPYDEKMLATITNTNIDVVRSAMKILTELHLVDILDDKTIFMDEIQKMVGSEGWSAERVRRFRQKEEEALQCNTGVTCGNVEKDLDLELESPISLSMDPKFQKYIDLEQKLLSKKID